MAKKKTVATTFTLFNVVYQDGSLRSNRRVPTAALDGHDADDQAKALIEQQDREVALLSGRPPGIIKTITRVR